MDPSIKVATEGSFTDRVLVFGIGKWKLAITSRQEKSHTGYCKDLAYGVAEFLDSDWNWRGLELWFVEESFEIILY